MSGVKIWNRTKFFLMLDATLGEGEWLVRFSSLDLSGVEIWNKKAATGDLKLSYSTLVHVHLRELLSHSPVAKCNQVVMLRRTRTPPTVCH